MAAAGVVVAFLIAGFLADALAPAPSGPTSSSYATTPTGVAAWAELLERSGHHVGQLRQDLGQAQLDPRATLVVLGARSLTPAAARRLDGFVRAGGRLVLSAASPARVLPMLIPDPPGWVAVSPRAFEAVTGGRGAGGVARVQTAGAGAWRGGAGLLEDPSGGALVVVRSLGDGQVVLLADPSPVQNRLLASADNAQLAFDLAGAPGRPVLFAEALHGYGAATGIAAIPGTFWLVFAGLCLACVAWALARGRRLGPPEQPAEIGQPPRSAYVDALAGAVTRARHIAGLTRLVRARIGVELERRLARRAGGGEVPRHEALMALGLSDREAELVLEPASSEEGEAELLVLGRALARLRSEP
jgi:hypothetical protein